MSILHLLLLLLLLLLPATRAQPPLAPDWTATSAAAVEADDLCAGTSHGPSGGAYVAGVEGLSASASLTLLDASGSRAWRLDWSGDGSAGAAAAAVVSSASGGTAYVVGAARYDLGGWDGRAAAYPSTGGAALWETRIGTPFEDRATAAALDEEAGALYVAGTTTGSMDGSRPPGRPDGFLARLNASDGAVVWRRQFGTDEAVNAAVAPADTLLARAGYRPGATGLVYRATADGERLVVSGYNTAWSSPVDGTALPSLRGRVVVFRRRAAATPHEVELEAVSDAVGSGFGLEHAVSGDGSALAVGAPDLTATGGRVHLWARAADSGAWTELPPVEHSLGSPSGADRFGAALSLSHDGAALLVGVPGRDQALLFLRAAGGASYAPAPAAALAAAAAPAAGSMFGAAVALSGDGLVAAVGSPAGDSDAGRVDVLAAPGAGTGAGAWTLQAGGGALVPTASAAGDEFGRAVALSGDGGTLVAATSSASAGSSRGAFVFARVGGGGSWSQTAALVPSLAPSSGVGQSVAVSEDGGTAAVGSVNAAPAGGAGAVGAVHVFVLGDGGPTAWAEQAVLEVAEEGLAAVDFGEHVSVSSDGSEVTAAARSGESWIYALSRSPRVRPAGVAALAADGGAVVAGRSAANASVTAPPAGGAAFAARWTAAGDASWEWALARPSAAAAVAAGAPCAAGAAACVAVSGTGGQGAGEADSGPFLALLSAAGGGQELLQWWAGEDDGEGGGVAVLGADDAAGTPLVVQAASLGRPGGFRRQAARAVTAAGDEAWRTRWDGEAQQPWRAGHTTARVEQPDGHFEFGGTLSDSFGHAVAVSACGTVAAVGAFGYEDSTDLAAGRADKGAVFVLDLDPLDGRVLARARLRDDATQSGEQFGYAVDLSADGTRLAVGAPFHLESGSDEGAVYVYARNLSDGGSWSREASFFVASGGGSTQLGLSLSMSDDGATLVAGEPNLFVPPDTVGVSSRVRVYLRDPATNTWSETASPFEATFSIYDFFPSVLRIGRVVALSGDGLVAAVPAVDVGEADARDISSSTAFQDASVQPGLVMMYSRDAANSSAWTARGTVKEYDTEAFAFGYSVALSRDGSVMVACAPAALSGRGAALVYERSNATGEWARAQELPAPVGENNLYGFSADVSDDASVVVVSAARDDIGAANQGSVFVFVRGEGEPAWALQGERLAAALPDDHQQFGWDVAARADGRAMLVGAPSTLSTGTFGQWGGAYVVAARRAPAPAAALDPGTGALLLGGTLAGAASLDGVDALNASAAAGGLDAFASRAAAADSLVIEWPGGSPNSTAADAGGGTVRVSVTASRAFHARPADASFWYVVAGPTAAPADAAAVPSAEQVVAGQDASGAAAGAGRSARVPAGFDASFGGNVTAGVSAVFAGSPPDDGEAYVVYVAGPTGPALGVSSSVVAPEAVLSAPAFAGGPARVAASLAPAQVSLGYDLSASTLAGRPATLALALDAADAAWLRIDADPAAEVGRAAPGADPGAPVPVNVSLADGGDPPPAAGPREVAVSLALGGVGGAEDASLAPGAASATLSVLVAASVVCEGGVAAAAAGTEVLLVPGQSTDDLGGAAAAPSCAVTVPLPAGAEFGLSAESSAPALVTALVAGPLTSASGAAALVLQAAPGAAAGSGSVVVTVTPSGSADASWLDTAGSSLTIAFRVQPDAVAVAPSPLGDVRPGAPAEWTVTLPASPYYGSVTVAPSLGGSLLLSPASRTVAAGASGADLALSFLAATAGGARASSGVVSWSLTGDGAVSFAAPPSGESAVTVRGTASLAAPPAVYSTALSDPGTVTVDLLPSPGASVQLAFRSSVAGLQFEPALVVFDGSDEGVAVAEFRARFAGGEGPASDAPASDLWLEATGTAAGVYDLPAANATLPVYAGPLAEVTGWDGGAAPPPVTTDAATPLALDALLPFPLPAEFALAAAFGLADGAPVPAENDALEVADAVGLGGAAAGEQPSGWFRCGSAAATPAGGAAAPSASYAVSCTLPAGVVGGPYRLALLHHNDSRVAAVSPASVVVSAAAPSVVAGTLRAGSRDAPGAAFVIGEQPDGPETLFFDADNVGTSAALLDVVFQEPGAVFPANGTFRCAPAALYPSVAVPGRATVECVIPHGEGLGMAATLRVGGREAVGTDEFTHLALPVVTAVTGCGADDGAGGTDGCPTVGLVTVTVSGFRFTRSSGSVPQVTVAGLPCANVTLTDPAGGELECELPSGTGDRQPVAVLATDPVLLQSRAEPLVSYAAPVIDAVESAQCQNDSEGNAVRLAGCERAASLRITVTGRHFGLEGARVFVGGEECVRSGGAAGGSEVVGPLADDTQRLVCNTTRTSGTSTAVFVLQQNGGITTESNVGPLAPELFFVECLAGTELDVNGSCARCPRNEFQASPLGGSCRGCPSGFYQAGNDPAREDCRECPDGGECASSVPALSRAGFWLYERRGGGGVLSSHRCGSGRCASGASCYEAEGVQVLPSLSAEFDTNHRSCCTAGRPPAERNPMCGACLDGLSEWGDRCVECSSTNGGIIFGYILLVAVTVIGIQLATLRNSGATLKTLVLFAQVAFTFFRDRSTAVSLGALVSLDVFDLSDTCVAPMSDLTKAVLPLIQFFALLGMLGLVFALNGAHWLLSGGRRRLKFKRSHFLRVLLAVMLFSYVPVLRVAVTLQQCDLVDAADPALSGEYLRAFPSERCSGGAYTAWFAVAWLMVASLLLGGGLFILTVGQTQYRAYLRRKELDLSDRRRRKLEKNVEVRFGFLFHSYRGRRSRRTAGASNPLLLALEVLGASWEAVILARSTVFVLVATLVDDWQSRFALLSLISLAFLVLHQFVLPYWKRRENLMEFGALLTLLVLGTLNSSSWYDTGAASVATSLLFYGYLSLLAVAGLYLSWRSGRLWDAYEAFRKAVGKTPRPPRRMSTFIQSNAEAAEVLRALPLWKRLLCWYLAPRARFAPGDDDEIGGSGAADGAADPTPSSRGTLYRAGAPSSRESAATSSRSALGSPRGRTTAAGSSAVSIELMDVANAAVPGGTGGALIDRDGRVWRATPCWFQAETGKSSWEAPRGATPLAAAGGARRQEKEEEEEKDDGADEVRSLRHSETVPPPPPPAPSAAGE